MFVSADNCPVQLSKVFKHLFGIGYLNPKEHLDIFYTDALIDKKFGEILNIVLDNLDRFFRRSTASVM